MKSKIVANPLSRADLRDFAYRIRKTLGNEKRLYFPIVEFLEFYVCNPEHLDFKCIVSPIHEMPINHGETDPDLKTIRIREDVYIGACQNIGRDRFTLAHEIGHALMHSAPLTLARIDPSVSIKTYCDPEWQANAFAGELLMPHHLIKNLSVWEIVDGCKVSFDAAEIQRRK